MTFEEKRSSDFDVHRELRADFREIKNTLHLHIAEEAAGLGDIKGDVKQLNTRINGALDKIAMFMESGVWWRRTIIGVVITILLQAFGGMMVATELARNYGKNEKQIEVNAHRLDTIESLLHKGTP